MICCRKEIAATYLWVPVHGIDGVGVAVRLISSAWCGVHIPHDSVASRYDGLRHCFLHLFLLLPVLGSSVLKPDLRKRKIRNITTWQVTWQLCTH